MDESPRRQSAQVNDEGELVDLKFCVYCSGINQPDATICQNCGEYIADQSPDLRSRLERISRRAHAAPVAEDEAHPQDLIGSVPEPLPTPRRSPVPRRSVSDSDLLLFFIMVAAFVLLALVTWLIGFLPHH